MGPSGSRQELPQTTDKPAFHGMLLFGRETAYLSHLPMFMGPHKYQAIFEVTLTKEGSDPLALYVQDRDSHGTNMYSFAPTNNFVLTDLVGADPARSRLTSFQGTIFRGHFEEGHFEEKGAPLLENVTASVTNVVYFQRLDPSTAPPANLEGILVGKGQDLFWVHVITRPPDYDQVIGISQLAPSLTDEDLRQGIRVSVPGRSNSIDAKIIPHGHALIAAHVQNLNSGTAQSLEVNFLPGEEYYFETADLAE